MVSPTFRSAIVTAALCLAASPLLAADGLLLVEKTTSERGTQINQIQIDKNRMRAETTGPTGEKQAMIFDGVKQVLWIVNVDRKTYSEITKEDVDRLSTQVSDAMSKLQEQLRNLPPEQRAQMEAIMKGRGGMALPGAPAAGAKTEYKKTGSDKVGKWTCDKYEGTLNGQKTSELCTVEPAALGFTMADFAVAGQLGTFFSKLMPQGAENMFRIGKLEDQGFSGVPVRRVSYAPRQSTTEISDVSRQTFADAVFAVPTGFTKEASPFGGRGRGRQ